MYESEKESLQNRIKEEKDKSFKGLKSLEEEYEDKL